MLLRNKSERKKSPMIGGIKVIMSGMTKKFRARDGVLVYIISTFVGKTEGV